LGAGLCEAAGDPALSLHGAGWMQFGRVEHSYATANASNDFRHNWLSNYGGIFVTGYQVDENWDAALGLGSLLVSLPRGSNSGADIWYPFWVGFLSEARVTYKSDDFAKDGGLQLTLGTFPYNYNPDSKNLGVYLLKGYVYPGAIESGYGDLFGSVGSRTGAWGRYSIGGLTNDLMALIETDAKPLYDMSFADVLTWKISSGFELGAGVNLYRYLAADEKATSPGKDCQDAFLGPYAGSGPGGGQTTPCFIVRKDSAGIPIDTITGSLSGIKLMTRFRFDPKAWLGGKGVLGENGFVLYGEAAIIGTKDYPILYDDIKRRIPVMLGLNLPGFNLFDWSVEGKYYASKNSSDNLPAQSGSWLPGGTKDPGTGRDDWKWSFNASKVLAGNIFLGFQVANDHLRLGGTHNNATGREAMRTPEDVYWAFKTAYFF
ncbi:MAG: hypothetical protein ABI036_21035, partial [Fibrobacteria bacterium]